MFQWLKLLAAKSEGLCSIPETHIINDINWSPFSGKLSFGLHICALVGELSCIYASFPEYAQ